MTNEFSPVDPDSVDTLVFDYTLLLVSGETMVSGTLIVAVEQSVDASAASRFGVPAVGTNTSQLTVTFTGLVANVNYYLRCLGVTSTSRTVVCSATLPCRIC